MSYSFSVRGVNKEEAMERVAAVLDEVVAGQPIHARDREAALAAVSAFVNVLPVDETRDVSVYVSGSVSWTGLSPNESIMSAGVNVSASLVAKEA